MYSKIFDIILLIFVFGSGVYGVYFAVKLRLKSNVMQRQQNEQLDNQDDDQNDDQNIVRIFDDLQKSAIAMNPEINAITETYRTMRPGLESYQEYLIHYHINQLPVAASNHVTV